MSLAIGTLSPADSGMSYFKECLTHLREGHPAEALLHARRALGTDPTNPFYLSYAGLLAALIEQRFGDAERLCLEALGMLQNYPQLYLNLAEVYQKARRPRKAIEVLEKGLASVGRDFRIRHALEKIGRRRAPVLSFLRRNHPLNRILGKLRHRLMGPLRTAYGRDLTAREIIPERKVDASGLRAMNLSTPI
jgi:tetratricopeptide (TPR) repeat protein